ncbi:lysoplasmalogenase-like protein TMEM86A isoform X2 [Pecten maximus]|uniref:lysoplasmalogenase-like protein TMEM86A isoform X2 n=1 Tax=Pecten maximus TaxID=6579 RepID=UPI001458C4A6|nr:lysoplasmalogenase-like protein TMEM86A isoform X2 [Pecten maximus]
MWLAYKIYPSKGSSVLTKTPDIPGKGIAGSPVHDKDAMESFKEELVRRMKNTKLFPFYGLLAFYYLTYLPFWNYPPVTFSAAFFKALPIWSLAFFVRQNAGVQPSDIFPKDYYSKFVMLGLLISSVGDACLVSRYALFIPGMLAFMIAHGCYLLAFGPSKVPESRIKSLYVLAGVASFCFISDAINSYVMQAIVLCYFVMIFIVGWRAQARYEHTQTYSALFGCLGMLFFMFSDFIIATDKWKSYVPFSEFIVLSFYYMAQFCIAISTEVDEPLERE